MKTHVNEQGRITIPATLRRKYGIRKGTRIVVADLHDSIVLRPITDKYLRILQGSLRGRGGLQVLMQERNKQSAHMTLNPILWRYSKVGS